MANLNLVGQQGEADLINPRLLRLKNRLDERKVLWSKLPRAKKKAWIQSGKDPIMTATWQLLQYLENNYQDMVEQVHGN